MKTRQLYWIIACVVVAGFLVAVLSQTSRRNPPTASSNPRPAAKARPNGVTASPSAGFTFERISEVSPEIRPALDNHAAYDERIGAVSRLAETNLPAVDQQALYAFLLARDPQDAEPLGQVLKNELMNTLCRMKPPPSQLADVLAQIYHDRGQDDVIRDYAIQHLAVFYLQVKKASAQEQEARHAELSEVRDVLTEALSETQSTIAGSALLSLSRLAQTDGGVDPDQIRKHALQLALSSDTGELTRITAFQVCGQYGASNALPVIQEAAQTSPSVPLRISAVAALGFLGGVEQEPYLKLLLDRGEERLKAAARRALDQIAAREVK